MAKILIVEDDAEWRRTYSEWLKPHYPDIITAKDGEEAIQKLEGVDLIISDARMPRIDGFELLRRVKHDHSGIAFIIITGVMRSLKDAVEAMKLGACDYLEKETVGELGLRMAVRNALEKASLLSKINIYETKLEEKYEIIGQSPKLKECLSQASMVANRNTTVLLLGETGTGKESLAHYIHKLSDRKGEAFFPINSGSLSENLLESELYGHERGAFTGATSLKKGIFELADKGTIFLDEIGEISANCQVKLLRVLQDGEILKVGGDKPINVDVRIIAATNKYLKKSVSEGSFRKDLFYRLSVFPIHLPPLRERKDDMPLLARYLINRHCKKMGRPNLQISDEMIQEFIKYDWPGNVRELENALERAVILAKGSEINHVSIKSILDLTDDSEYSYVAGKRLEEMTDVFEKKVISLALAENNGDVEKTADKLGVSKSTLYLKINKYGLKGS